MKLKTLMANSLPRLRGHRHKVDNLHTLESYTNTDVTTNKLTARDGLNNFPCETKLLCWQQDDDVNVNLNILSSTDKCSVNKHISPCCSPDGTLIRTVSEYKRDRVSSESDYNTVPRVRPRIRTNPWVSPRTTPTDSPIAVRSPVSSFSNGIRRMSNEDKNNDFIIPSEWECLERRNDEKHKLTYDDKNHDAKNSKHVERIKESTKLDHTEAEVEYSQQKDKDNDKDSQFNPDMCISFEYEEMFESQIESAIGSSVDDEDEGDDDVFECSSPFSRDSSWGDYDTRFGEAGVAYNSSSTNSCENLEAISSDELASEDTDDTLCSDREAISGNDNNEANDGIGFESPESITDDSERHSTCSQSDNDLSPGIMECSFQSMDSAMGSSIYTTDGFDGDTQDLESPFRESFEYATGQGRARSIEDVRYSLQEKVQRLKQQKNIVAEKVRAAQEEERVRAQEKLRFQRQMTLNRKQMLLQTVFMLKQKLESQSRRLQNTYDNVLQIQRTSVMERKVPNSVCAVP